MRHVASILKQAPQDVQPPLLGLLAPCQAAAYQEIVGTLLERGFTKEQIDQWDRGPEFELDLTAMWVLTKGGALEAFSDLYLARLDRRKELKTVQVFVNGQWIRPDTAPLGPGVVSYGEPDWAAQGGVFNWPSPDEVSTRPIRW